MSARTGLGAPEVAVLDAVAGLGGTPHRRPRRTTHVLEALEHEQGFAGRYAYPMLQDLAVPWRLHLPLLDPDGNWGSQHGDPASPAQYTEVRLSEVGALALAAERGEVGPVPLGLIEGSLYRDGPVPPFAPGRVLEALTTGDDDAGPPALPTGGTVEGDVAGLLAGRRARLVLGCTIVEECGHLVITEVPLGVAGDDVVRHLSQRATPHLGPRYVGYLPESDQPALPAPPVRDVRDETSVPNGVRVVCILASGADTDEARRWLRSVWPVTVEVDCRLPAPMRRRLRSWERGDGSGLAALDALVRDHH